MHSRALNLMIVPSPSRRLTVKTHLVRSGRPLGRCLVKWYVGGRLTGARCPRRSRTMECSHHSACRCASAW